MRLRPVLLILCLTLCLALMASVHSVARSPDALKTPISETETSVFSQMYATATAYREDSTATALAFTVTPTTNPVWLTESAYTQTVLVQNYYTDIAPFAPTATARWLTQAAEIAPPRTSAPPVTEQELSALRLQWKKELEGAVGFTHPVFDDVVDGLVQSASFTHPDYVRGYHVYTEIERLTYGGNSYIAIIARESFVEFVSRFMLFQMIGSEPVLLPYPITHSAGYIMSYRGWFESDYLGGFADRNGNGYPDLAIDTGTGGSSPTLVLILLEFRRGGEIVDITPVTTDVSPREFVDVNGDGILEIRARADYYEISSRFGNCCDPVLTRYYAWDGTAYRDISSTLDESYWPFVREFWEHYFPALEQGIRECRFSDSRELHQVLIDYFAMGRLDEGWTRIQPLLQMAESCPPDIVAKIAVYIAEVEAWVERSG